MGFVVPVGPDTNAIICPNTKGMVMKQKLILLYFCGCLLGCATGSSETDSDTIPNFVGTATESGASSTDTGSGSEPITPVDTTTGAVSSEQNADVDSSGAVDLSDSESESALDSNTSDCNLPKKKYLSAAQVHTIWETACPRILYLNVVDATYYNLGHIPGSIEIPWDTLESRLGEVDKELTILIYCRKGVRSENAYTTLMNADYPRLYVMEDGIEPWIAAGYETEPVP